MCLFQVEQQFSCFFQFFFIALLEELSISTCRFVREEDRNNTKRLKANNSSQLFLSQWFWLVYVGGELSGESDDFLVGVVEVAAQFADLGRLFLFLTRVERTGRRH